MDLPPAIDEAGVVAELRDLASRNVVKKSLIVIASALVLAVGAATTDRLRYDSSVFADPVGPRSFLDHDPVDPAAGEA